MSCNVQKNPIRWCLNPSVNEQIDTIFKDCLQNNITWKDNWERLKYNHGVNSSSKYKNYNEYAFVHITDIHNNIVIGDLRNIDILSQLTIECSNDEFKALITRINGICSQHGWGSGTKCRSIYISILDPNLQQIIQLPIPIIQFPKAHASEIRNGKYDIELIFKVSKSIGNNPFVKTNYEYIVFFRKRNCVGINESSSPYCVDRILSKRHTRSKNSPPRFVGGIKQARFIQNQQNKEIMESSLQSNINLPNFDLPISIQYLNKNKPTITTAGGSKNKKTRRRRRRLNSKTKVLNKKVGRFKNKFTLRRRSQCQRRHLNIRTKKTK